MSTHKKTIGVVGARGFVGAELIRLIDAHKNLELIFASSRSLKGQALSRVVPGCYSELQFEHLSPEEVGQQEADVTVLALPNGLAAEYVQHIHTQKIVIDLSADFRFDDTWYYGLPEITRSHAAGQTRISNPGCYATAMQLALMPIRELLNGPPACFGVSGYSGAGSKPSDNNNPELLRNNILPYGSVNHIHEREVSRQIGQPIDFMPNVASFFRGIAMTVNAHLTTPTTLEHITDRFETFYDDEPLVTFQEQAPRVGSAINKTGAWVGGCALNQDGNRLVVHSTLDNLLKGAASQALQNINLACGLNELEGIRVD